VTYEELARLTGEPLREVNFTLPPNNVPMLRQVPGFESFDPAKEVLHCDKPGTGSVDAPRAFSLKLQGVLERIGLKPCSVDPELWFLHKDQKLAMVLTKHVDDLKATGETDIIVHVFGELQKVFGELKINGNIFTNCRVRHEQDTTAMAVTLDQIHYVDTLRCITHPQLSTGAATDDSEESLHKLYMSLLGAVAYLAHTRLDIVVFVCALQRHSAKSKLEHVKRLNRLLRWIQRNPKKLHYSPGAGSRMAASTAASYIGAARKPPNTEHPPACPRLLGRGIPA